MLHIAQEKCQSLWTDLVDLQSHFLPISHAHNNPD